MLHPYQTHAHPCLAPPAFPLPLQNSLSTVRAEPSEQVCARLGYTQVRALLSAPPIVDADMEVQQQSSPKPQAFRQRQSPRSILPAVREESTSDQGLTESPQHKRARSNEERNHHEALKQVNKHGSLKQVKKMRYMNSPISSPIFPPKTNAPIFPHFPCIFF